jgi:hypothetical protein
MPTKQKPALRLVFALYAKLLTESFHLLSPLFSRQATFPTMSVSSLRLGLTSLFGMGKGVTLMPNQENKGLKIETHMKESTLA